MIGSLDKTVTVQFVNPPKPGKKRGTIKTTEGETFGVWPDRMSLFQAGGTYDIALETTTYNGASLTNVIDVRPISGPTPVRQADRHDAAPAAAISGKDEQIFVLAILKELIRAGHVKGDKQEIWNAIAMLRNQWLHSFGGVTPPGRVEPQRHLSRA